MSHARAALCVVTGTSRGIGRATARALARRGCALSLLGRSSPQLSALSDELSREGAPVHLADCDLSDPTQIERACARVLSEFGVPDVVVNNAGVVHRESVIESTLEHYCEQLDVNLRAPFFVCRAFLPAMLERRSGRLLHVGSISSTLGTAKAAAYCASKWGLLGFMKSLAEELRDSGLMTLAVLPGSVQTDMLEGSGFVPRMSAEDVAETLVHYALDAPLAHNGAVIEMFGV